MAKKRRRKRRRRRTKKVKQSKLTGYGLIILMVILMGATIGAIKFVNSPSFTRYNQSGVSQQHQDFINKVLPSAIDVQKKYKILASITLGQAILESDWGQSQLASKYNNLFGVKADANQKGVELSTTEYANGKPQTITGRFRVYDNWNQSIEAHAQLLAHGTDWNNMQYKEVVQANDYKQSAAGLSSDGYATDPAYAQKIIQIIEKYHLNKYDKNKK